MGAAVVVARTDVPVRSHTERLERGTEQPPRLPWIDLIFSETQTDRLHARAAPPGSPRPLRATSRTPQTHASTAALDHNAQQLHRAILRNKGGGIGQWRGNYFQAGGLN